MTGCSLDHIGFLFKLLSTPRPEELTRLKEKMEINEREERDIEREKETDGDRYREGSREKSTS